MIVRLFGSMLLATLLTACLAPRPLPEQASAVTKTTELGVAASMPGPPGTPGPTPTLPPLLSAAGLPEPAFEDPAAVPAWARPVAPETSSDPKFSSDGRTLIYTARHPGTYYRSLYSVALADGAPVRLSWLVVEFESPYFEISPDGMRVNFHHAWSPGLYSSALDGSDTITLTTEAIYYYSFTPDGRWLLYTAAGPHGEFESFVRTPARGGAAVPLGPEIGAGMMVGNYLVTPDSRYLVVSLSSSPDVSRTMALYSIPIEGGTPVRLDLSLPEPIGSHHFPMVITSDSQQIVLDPTGGGANVLYAIPVTGGPARRLNLDTPNDGWVSGFTLSPDDQWLVYTPIDPQRQFPLRTSYTGLFSLPLTGGPVVQLNGPLPVEETIEGMLWITPDSQRVVYRQMIESVSEFTYTVGVTSTEVITEYAVQQQLTSTWIVPIAGGTPTPFPTTTWGHVSPDGRWFVYGVEETEGTPPHESVLYSFPMAGGEPIRLGPPAGSGGLFSYMVISPDSRTVVYATGEYTTTGKVMTGLYQVPIAGGEPVQLAGRGGNDQPGSWRFAPDGTLLGMVDYDGDGEAVLYAFGEQVPIVPPRQQEANQEHLLLPWMQR